MIGLALDYMSGNLFNKKTKTFLFIELRRVILGKLKVC